nr:MAG TPA: hypothetical protein [Caudoviricetes sp.]
MLFCRVLISLASIGSLVVFGVNGYCPLEEGARFEVHVTF